jgi:predicted PurR-regulated permease PerM
MSLTRQVSFWAITIAVFALALWLLHDVLLPFVAGLALAYLLNPLANRIERAGGSRLIAALIIVGGFVLGSLLLIILVAPLLGNQLTALIAKLPAYLGRLQELVTDRPWLSKIVGEGFSEAQQSTGELVKQGVEWGAGFLKSLWSGGRALVSIFSLLIVTPIVAFYLIYDWNRMVTAVDSIVPLPYRQTVRALAVEMNAAIGGYFRGQTLVALALGFYYAISLSVSGLNFGLLIGFLSGFLTFIPYVGSLTGLVVAVGVAIAQFWPNYPRILIVLGIFLIGQFMEGNVLSPKLVGDRVGLHPVWLMFALFAFGYLFGFVGLRCGAICKVRSTPGPGDPKTVLRCHAWSSADRCRMRRGRNSSPSPWGTRQALPARIFSKARAM